MATVVNTGFILLAYCKELGIVDGIEAALPHVAMNFAGTLAAAAYTALLNR